MQFRWNVAPMVALFAFAFGVAAFGQDLFDAHNAKDKHAPLTEEQKAAGEKEAIF